MLGTVEIICCFRAPQKVDSLLSLDRVKISQIYGGRKGQPSQKINFLGALKHQSYSENDESDDLPLGGFQGDFKNK